MLDNAVKKDLFRVTGEDPVSLGETGASRRTSIDLFAGCGGLSLGLENAGFNTVFVNELNDDARATYLANRHHSIGGRKFADFSELHCSDIEQLTSGKSLRNLTGVLESLDDLDIRFGPKEQGNLDLLAGGPPCQGFSGIGIRRSYSVDKQEIPSNQLYHHMAKVVRRLRPRIFLFENVRGLMWARWTPEGEPGEIFKDIQKVFRRIPGYEVRWSLVHAKDYGVPQNRPRVLLVGMRRDVLADSKILDPAANKEDAVACGFLPLPIDEAYPHLEHLLGDLIDPKVEEIIASGEYPRGKFETTRYPCNPKTQIQKQLRQAPSFLEGPVDLTDHEYSKHGPIVVAKFQHMLKSTGEIPEQFRTKKFAQRRLPPQWVEGKGPTITATSLPDDYVHFAQPRILTVREWARLQLFPDWYKFEGKRTTGGLRRAGNPREGLYDREVPKYTQIGNAVPVGLAEHVGRHFMAVLDEVS